MQPGVVHAGGRPGNPSVPQTLGFGLQIPGLLLATAQHPLTGRAWSFLPESSLQSTPPLLGSGALRTRTHLPLQGSQSLPPGRQSLLSPEWELGPLASGPLVGWHLCGPGGHCSTGEGGKVRDGPHRAAPRAEARGWVAQKALAAAFALVTAGSSVPPADAGGGGLIPRGTGLRCGPLQWREWGCKVAEGNMAGGGVPAKPT